MKKLISFLLSVTLCGSMLTIFPAASWDLDEQEAVEGDISSYVQVEEVTFGEPEPLAETLNEEDLYQLEMVGDFFEVEADSQEEQPAVQPMADLPDLSVRNLRINAGDMTSPYPAGMAMYYTFQLLNYGTADAEDAEIIVKLDGEVATYPVPMGTVPAGMGGNIQFRGPEMTPGTHTMEIVVNPDNKIVESNYDNNTTSSTFTYEACFELVAVEITSNKQGGESSVPTYKLGESVTFTMTFQNSGLLAVENVPIALFGTFRAPGEQPVTSQMGYTNYIAEMPAKTKMSAVVKLNFTREASARISFTLDPEEILGDMDYSNNTAETNLKIISAKYALCIGVVRDSGDESGNFLPNVQGTHEKFTAAGINSTLSTSPDIGFMLSTNSQSNRNQLASEILFFNGHASPKAICFRSNQNNTGVRYNDTAQISLDLTYENGTETVMFAGMRPQDFQYVELASFIGCSTGLKWMDGSSQMNSIAEIATDRGAQASIGFKDVIHSRNSSGKKWIQDYITKLCEGYTLQEAIEWANGYSSADLAMYVDIFGDENYQMIESNATTYNEMADNLLDIPYQLNSSLQRNCFVDEKATEHMEFQEIYSLVESVDPSFDMNKYHISTNFYSESLDNGFIRLQYFIGDKIETSMMYNITYRDGKIMSIIKLPLTVPMNNNFATEEQLLKKVESYQQMPQTYSLELPDFGDNVIVEEQKQKFVYDYQTGELKDVHTYILTFLEEDSTYDLYDQEVIIS